MKVRGNTSQGIVTPLKLSSAATRFLSESILRGEEKYFTMSDLEVKMGKNRGRIKPLLEELAKNGCILKKPVHARSYRYSVTLLGFLEFLTQDFGLEFDPEIVSELGEGMFAPISIEGDRRVFIKRIVTSDIRLDEAFWGSIFNIESKKGMFDSMRLTEILAKLKLTKKKR